MLNLNKDGSSTSFLYIKNSFFNLQHNLKLETFDYGTFLYKVHELLLITLHCPSTDQKCSWVMWSICIACQQMLQFGLTQLFHHVEFVHGMDHDQLPHRTISRSINCFGAISIMNSCFMNLIITTS